MLQILGSFMIIIGSLGIGYCYIEKERKKINRIEKWESIMQMFVSEIMYKKQPLFLACYEIGEKIGETEGEVLKKISRNMQEIKRESFHSIWKRECESYCLREKIDRETMAMINNFAVLTGFEDEIVQKKMIEEQKEKWKKLRVKLQDELQERKRIILLLSSCLGMVMVIILW